MGQPRITAACITRSLQPRTSSTTTLSGIDKAPVDIAILGPDGISGDRVLDTEHHGGADQAVYAYADEDAAWWAAQLDSDIPPGRFGENLRTTGIDVTGAIIGERWQIDGRVLVEVTAPRIPCATFQHHMDDRSGWVKRFTQAGRPGAYLRVLEPGAVQAGQPVTVLDRPDHGVTIGRWFADADPDAARSLLTDGQRGWRMSAVLRAHAEHVLTRR